MTSSFLFWLYLGGCVGWTLCRISSPEVQELFRHQCHVARKKTRWGPAFVTASVCLGIALWPLSVIGYLVGLHALAIRYLDKKFMHADYACVTCGLTARVSAPRNAIGWTQFPVNWYVNPDFELACSPECAHAYDRSGPPRPLVQHRSSAFRHEDLH